MAKEVEFGKFRIIEVTRDEMLNEMKGLAICDNCNEPMTYGYYIAVLNMVFCPKCFEKWKKRAVYYEEDAKIEKKNYSYYAWLLDL